MTNSTTKKRGELSVLQLGKFWPMMGGVEKVMYEFATGLSARGVHCDILAAAARGKGREQELPGGARLYTCRTWRKVAATMISPSMVTQLHRKMRSYDVVHVHHPDPMAAFALFMSGYKGKVVLHWHSDIAKQKHLLRFYMPLQKWLIRRADVVVGTTPVYVNSSPFLHGARDKLTYLPIGVNPIPADPAGSERVRQRYGGRKIVFSLGRLVAYKGFEYLIEAARYLTDDYVVLIGGAGAMGQYLEDTIDRHGVRGRVHLLGRISDADLPAYYGACSLFCLSSVQKTEAFGIVQVEAMSCGKPVVTTTIPGSGVPWVNAHGVSGLNVPPRDAQALGRAILDVTADADTYRRFATQARQRYEEMFTKTRMIDRLLELYARLGGQEAR